MVSVIIPNYNHSSYLKNRIDSVLNQSFQNFEIIILDDYSSDNSREIIEKYRHHSKVSHIVFNTKNSGSTFSQWQKGIELCKGEWIWIAESDDVAESTFLETTLRSARENNEVVCSFCASREINSKGEWLKIVDWANNISKRNWNEDYIAYGVDEIKTQFYYKCIIPNASAAIFKKSAVDLNIFQKLNKKRFAGDWLFWVKLMEKGNLSYSSKVLNNFRVHSNTTRSIKSEELEIQRFSESLSVIFYIKNKYDLSWNWDKHFWIINDWFYKSRFNSKKGNFKIFQLFPFTYQYRMLVKYGFNKLKNTIKIG